MRRARREWIAAHHPDRGGDPEAFEAGLAHFARMLDDAHGRPAAGTPQQRAAVYRSRSPRRRLQLLVRRMRRRLRGQPPRTLR